MKLISVNISKEKGRNIEIKYGPEYQYLAKIQYNKNIIYLSGYFTKQWYGPNFSWFAMSMAGLQFDPIGENSSPWVALWEIVE